MTITLDRYGQPLTGADADRLAQLQARTYWATHARNPGIARGGKNTPDD